MWIVCVYQRLSLGRVILDQYHSVIYKVKWRIGLRYWFERNIRLLLDVPGIRGWSMVKKRSVLSLVGELGSPGIV